MGVYIGVVGILGQGSQQDCSLLLAIKVIKYDTVATIDNRKSRYSCSSLSL
jgi:hypothetical protein